MFVRVDQAAHWYSSQTGAPCHEIEGKNGVKRAPRIDEAIRLGLVPSVTNILRTLAKPSLEAWKQNQLIYSALTHPNPQNLPAHDFAEIIAKEAAQEAKDAATKGAQIHSAIGDYFNEIQNPLLPENFPAFAKAHAMNKIYIEKSFANEMFGGQIDYIGTFDGKLSLIDFKTTKDKPDGVTYYPEWHLQLAAYLYGYASPRQIEQVVSVVLPATNEIDFKIWTHTEDAFAAFLAISHVWQWKTGWNERLLNNGKRLKRSA